MSEVARTTFFQVSSTPAVEGPQTAPVQTTPQPSRGQKVLDRLIVDLKFGPSFFNLQNKTENWHRGFKFGVNLNYKFWVSKGGSANQYVATGLGLHASSLKGPNLDEINSKGWMINPRLNLVYGVLSRNKWFGASFGGNIGIAKYIGDFRFLDSLSVSSITGTPMQVGGEFCLITGKEIFSICSEISYQPGANPSVETTSGNNTLPLNIVYAAATATLTPSAIRAKKKAAQTPAPQDSTTPADRKTANDHTIQMSDTLRDIRAIAEKARKDNFDMTQIAKDNYDIQVKANIILGLPPEEAKKIEEMDAAKVDQLIKSQPGLKYAYRGILEHHAIIQAYVISAATAIANKSSKSSIAMLEGDARRNTPFTAEEIEQAHRRIRIAESNLKAFEKSLKEMEAQVDSLVDGADKAILIKKLEAADFDKDVLSERLVKAKANVEAKLQQPAASEAPKPATPKVDPKPATPETPKVETPVKPQTPPVATQPAPVPVVPKPEEKTPATPKPVPTPPATTPTKKPAKPTPILDEM